MTSYFAILSFAQVERAPTHPAAIKKIIGQQFIIIFQNTLLTAYFINTIMETNERALGWQ